VFLIPGLYALTEQKWFGKRKAAPAPASAPAPVPAAKPAGGH
jgi:hypothetical protein